MANFLKIRGQGKSDPIIILKVNDRRFKYRTFIHSTGIPIQSNLWDKRKGRARIIHGREEELNNLNQYLDKLEKSVITYMGNRHESRSLSKEDFKVHLVSSKVDEKKIEEDKIEKQDSFFALWQKFIDTAKNSSGEKITSGTRRSKKQTLKLVESYCRKKGIKLTLESIDMAFYHNFDLYMQEMLLNGNTRGKHFKEIKAILREAQDRDMSVNLAYQKKSFKVIRAASDSIYLNDKEIKKIFKADLPPSLSQQRDIFVMACFVGARHSDWHQIKQSNISLENKKEILKLQQKKTSEIIHIPIHPAVRTILDKYNGEPPRVISNQKFNNALKTIGKKAELEKVTVNSVSVDKSSQITTHTARRSFATNAYLSKTMDVHQIMKCTGHKTEVSFLKYLKLNGKDFAIEAADSKFFNDRSWTTVKK